jgi:serine/threonine protein kinase
MPPIQEGGKLLGEGVYGCVFDAPLQCTKRKRVVKDKSTKPAVGKITSVQTGQLEFNMTSQLAPFPGADKYFVLIDEFCIPEAKAKQKDPDIDKCELLQGAQITKQSQLIMPFGGTPLRTVPHTPQRIHYYKMGQHLLEAGTILLMQGVVHRDIHPMNILVDSPTTCKLIDFGMAWRPDLLTLANMTEYKMYLQFEPTFMQEPPEVTYGNGKRSDVDDPIIFARIFDKKQELMLVQKVLGIPKSAQINRLKSFLQQSKSVQEQNTYAFFKVYWSKFDAWAIGANLLTLWTDLVYDPAFEHQPYYKTKKQDILRVLRGLMDCDAARRMDCAEALQVWAPESPLLQNTNVKKWLKEQAAIRAKL